MRIASVFYFILSPSLLRPVSASFRTCFIPYVSAPCHVCFTLYVSLFASFPSAVFGYIFFDHQVLHHQVLLSSYFSSPIIINLLFSEHHPKPLGTVVDLLAVLLFEHRSCRNELVEMPLRESRRGCVRTEAC